MAFLCALLIVVGLGPAAQQQNSLPRVFILDAKQLATTKQRARVGDPVLTKLEADARKALLVGPFSVTSKQVTPPSGDKRDYMSRSEETRLKSSHLVISYAVFCLKKTT